MKFKLFNFACLAILLLLQNFNMHASQLDDPNWSFCYVMTKREGMSRGCKAYFYGQ